MQPQGLPPTCRCPCNQMKQTDVLHEVERLQVETKNQQGVIDALKNQVSSVLRRGKYGYTLLLRLIGGFEKRFDLLSRKVFD